MEQRERLQQLNMQAHFDAQSRHDELVTEAFLGSDKVRLQNGCEAQTKDFNQNKISTARYLNP
jgi:hypothetical protein